MLKSIFFLFFYLLSSIAIGKNYTFFVAADPHYGYSQWDNNEQTNKDAIDDMNSLPCQEFPDNFKRLGLSKVGTPKGVIVAGDLTGQGSSWDWSGYLLRDGFVQDYGLNGDRRLHFPVLEGYGNHDVDPGNDAVLNGIRNRNRNRSTPIHVSSNGLHYSWDWDDVHFVQLNLFPGEDRNSKGSLSFLRDDLASQVGNSGRGVILIHHFEFNVETDRWFSQEAQNRYYDVIKNYHVLAIFAGHLHYLSHYNWNNIPVFVAPSIKDAKEYFVVHLLDDRLFVALRRQNHWEATWDLPLLSLHEGL